MSKGDTFENDLLRLIFQAIPIANIADNAASSPLTQLWISLHTADPGESGGQSTNETSYGGYARVALARSVVGWTVTGNVVSPAANVDFPACTSGTPTITHVAVGTASSGAGKQLYRGALTPNISVSPGIQPRLTTGSTFTEE